jgi:hypothetical protein
MYRLSLEYLTLPSRGVDIERALYINGEVPFLGADTLLFSRMWTDADAVRTDNQGNQIRPAQQEVFAWQTADFKDPLGYETAPYRFHLNKGKNTLRLVGTNEPMTLRSLTLDVPAQIPAYTQYYETAKYLAGQPSGMLMDIPGEAAQLRSSPSLYARYDRSSPATVPGDLSRVVLNYIGGGSLAHPGAVDPVEC